MRALITGVLIALTLSLGACASSNGAVLLAPSAQITAAKGLYGFELAYSTAASAYAAALPQLTATGKKDAAKKLMLALLDCSQQAATGKCVGYVQLARDAVAAGDAADLATQAAAITEVADQLAAIINSAKTGD